MKHTNHIIPGFFKHVHLFVKPSNSIAFFMYICSQDISTNGTLSAPIRSEFLFVFDVGI